jgi:hypothetical protein
VTTIRDVIQRDLADEIQSVIKVAETERLATDLQEYVLTDLLARQFADVFEKVVQSARPAGGAPGKVGVWVSGFFGSGKSHFAKLIGHLAADTETPAGTARELFQARLRPGNARHDRLAGLLQEARTYGLRAAVVAFDITAVYGDPTDSPARIVLRAFQNTLGLSMLVAFAEREMQLKQERKYEAFLKLYESRQGRPWSKDRDASFQSYAFAECLAELLPAHYPTPEIAHQSLELALEQLEKLSAHDVARRLINWLEAADGGPDARTMIFFVADEVGAWAGRNLDRIEQVRALVEQFDKEGRGRLWFLATSQERLSDVVQNAGTYDAKATLEFIQRLEARFGVNVHLEPSEVGIVIEDRVLLKRPDAQKPLAALFRDRQATIMDAAAPPGLELQGQYPAPTEETFFRDYPFLPYQLPLAADIFGGMRGVKVSSGARSMLKVSFEATKGIADAPLGFTVAWDQIFDAANGENEFADENYLGTPGLQRLEQADKDFGGRVPIERPSRILKVLWLAQQTNRVPTTERNLARLMLDRLDQDVLDLEGRIAETLSKLAGLDYVRQDPASRQWRFLTPDQVTVERIVSRIAGEVPMNAVRAAIHERYASRLKTLGKVAMGRSSTAFSYEVSLNDDSLANAGAPVSLEVRFESTPRAKTIREEHAAYIADAVVHWLVPIPEQLEDRVRRVLAIAGLERDKEYNEKKTSSTQVEADKIQSEAGEVQRNIDADVSRALGRGTLLYGGASVTLDGGKDPEAAARTRVEEAIKDRIALRYPRFPEGDRRFDAKNIDRLLDTPAPRRGQLDLELDLFDSDGHVKLDNVLASALSSFLAASPKTSGTDISAHFGAPEFGWPDDLMRYVAVAMFVDGRVALADRTGKRHDDPKSPGARAAVGRAEFKSVRVVIEENPLTPEEISALRTLLSDLGEKTADGSELILHDTVRRYANKTATRLGAVQRAQAVGLQLAAAFDPLPSIMDEVNNAGSRSTALRTALGHAEAFRAGNAALGQLETFINEHGLEQFQRSERLLEAALQAGLTDDPKLGPKLDDARQQLEEIKAQRRVLADWTGAYAEYRTVVLDAYRSVYAPLYADARAQVDAGRLRLRDSDEMGRLTPEAHAKVNVEFSGRGQPLEEIPEAQLKSEADLLTATGTLPIPLLRAKRDGVDAAVAKALARAEELDAKGPAPTTWSTAKLGGKVLSDEPQVDDVFDAAKDEVKALIRQGKIVRTI